MKVQATAKFIRISPRKARLVVDAVRGLPVEQAERMLQLMQKKAAEPVLKLVKSAIANAEHNYQLKKENLFIAAITANEGFTIKRYRARAFGRAGMIRKRTSHLTVVLDEKKGSKTVKPEAKEKVEATDEKKAEEKKAPAKKVAPKATGTSQKKTTSKK